MAFPRIFGVVGGGTALAVLVSLCRANLLYLHTLSIWDEQVYDPQSNACDSSLNVGSDRSGNNTARQTGSRPAIRGSRLRVT